MRTLYLIKHGAPRIEAGRVSHDWHLSDEGRGQARQAAVGLRGAGVSIVVSSEEQKARETAEVLAAELGVGTRAMLGLHEQLRYAAPHLSTREAFRARVCELFARPTERVFGDETADEAHARFRTAVGAVMRASAGDVAVVAHGTVMALLVARANGRDPAALWRRLSDLSVLKVSWPELRMWDTSASEDDPSAPK